AEQLLQAFLAELFVLGVVRLGYAVGEDEEHIAWAQLHGRLFVLRLREHADHGASDGQLLDLERRGVSCRWPAGPQEIRGVVAGVDVAQLPTLLVELRIEEGGVLARRRRPVDELVHARNEAWRRHVALGRNDPQ